MNSRNSRNNRSRDLLVSRSVIGLLVGAMVMVYLAVGPVVCAAGSSSAVAVQTHGTSDWLNTRCTTNGAGMCTVSHHLAEIPTVVLVQEKQIAFGNPWKAMVVMSQTTSTTFTIQAYKLFPTDPNDPYKKNAIVEFNYWAGN